MERLPLDVERVRAAVGESWPRLEIVAETGSTNADLLADEDAPHRSVLIAEHQVAGRGRLDRGWVSPPYAGLTFSVLLRPTPPIPTWGWLPLLAGVAVGEAVTGTAGVPAALKWPNDVLAADGRKLAGVLAQTSGDAVVVGIGLNVSTTADELAVPDATSLAELGATVLDRVALLAALLTSLDAQLQAWTDARGDAEASGLLDRYREACSTIGRQVAVVAMDGRALQGIAVAVDPDGRLRIRTADQEQVVGAGDVRHLRPS
jgi:BirA family biotin operon repressor/biotin-[acetyl-CoA-carboxylase] ligase